jgi:hypothetical protein
MYKAVLHEKIFNPFLMQSFKVLWKLWRMALVNDLFDSLSRSGAFCILCYDVKDGSKKGQSLRHLRSDWTNLNEIKKFDTVSKCA